MLAALTSLPIDEDDIFMEKMEKINASIEVNMTSASNETIEAEEEEEEECEIPEDELDMCHLQALDTTVKKIRMVCELAILIWSIIYLAIAIRFLNGYQSQYPTSHFIRLTGGLIRKAAKK